jgi:hypothetical protein
MQPSLIYLLNCPSGCNEDGRIEIMTSALHSTFKICWHNSLLKESLNLPFMEERTTFQKYLLVSLFSVLFATPKSRTNPHAHRWLMDKPSGVDPHHGTLFSL